MYLVRDGLFDNLDVVLHWYPGDGNDASLQTEIDDSDQGRRVV